jgi:hypothetical protein
MQTIITFLGVTWVILGAISSPIMTVLFLYTSTYVLSVMFLLFTVYFWYLLIMGIKHELKIKSKKKAIYIKWSFLKI